jgi:hypothetical protein
VYCGGQVLIQVESTQVGYWIFAWFEITLDLITLRQWHLTGKQSGGLSVLTRAAHKVPAALPTWHLGNEDFMDYDREAHLCRRLGVVLTRRVPAINFDLVRAWNRHELLLFLQTWEKNPITGD